MNWMTAGMIAGAAVLAGAIVLLSIVLVILLRYRLSGTIWERSGIVPEFCASRYEPMMWLTSREDFDFLARQPGYRPEIGVRFRADRRRIFRMYLRDLARSFRSTHAAARKIAADLPESHADLIGFLVRCQTTFWRRMILIELRLLLPAARLSKFDPGALLEPIESIHLLICASPLSQF